MYKCYHKKQENREIVKGKCRTGKHRVLDFSASLLLMVLAFLLMAGPVRADEKHSGVAGENDVATPREVVKYGMLPIYPRDIVEGNYEIEIDSSSNFFHINRSTLNVEGGKMTARLIMASHSYEVLYAGTAEEAAAAPYADYIKPKEDNDGNYVWELEVEALDKAMYCAAYSKNRHMWYDRQILFNAGSLPEGALLVDLPDYHRIEWAMEELDKKQGTDSKDDQKGDQSKDSASQEASGGSAGSDASANGSQGEDGNAPDGNAQNGNASEGNDGEILEDEMDRAAFIVTDAMETDIKDGEYSIEVNMTGGSGRATISSPTLFIVKKGRTYARLLWSSSYYDYMIVGGKKYLNETKDGGNSTFTIPVARMDSTIPVIADTTAMGDPVEIEYNLTFYKDTIGEKGLIPQEAAKKVLIIALVVILLGAVLNHIVKSRRKGR